VIQEGSRPASAEHRLKELGIQLPAPPEPFGTYSEAVQTGNLLFLTGMHSTEGRAAKFNGRVGAELDVEAGRNAAYLAALNGLAVARQCLGSVDRVIRIIRIGVSVATARRLPRPSESRGRRFGVVARSSVKTRIPAAWCTELRAFHSAPRSNSN